MTNKTKIIIGAVVLLIIATAVIFVIFRVKKTLVSYQFNGTLVKVDKNTAIVNGEFVNTNGTTPTSPQHVLNVNILLDSKTKFTRTALQLPTQEGLKITGGKINVNDLKSSTEQTDLAGFNKDVQVGVGIGIYAISGSNIYGKSSFTPTEIKYTVGIPQ